MNTNRLGFRLAFIGLLVFIIFKYVQIFILHHNEELATVDFLFLGLGASIFIIVTLSLLGVVLPYREILKTGKAPEERVTFLVDVKNGMKASIQYSVMAAIFLLIFYKTTGSNVYDEIVAERIELVKQELDKQEGDVIVDPNTGEEITKEQVLISTQEGLGQLSSPLVITGATLLIYSACAFMFSLLSAGIFRKLILRI